MRSLVLLALVSASSLAAPPLSTESAGTLGRPDLASSSRVHSLVQLDDRHVIAIDAAGFARLWDVADWQQLGVASPGTRALVGPAGLGLPPDRSAGCLLAAPLAATRDGRLVTAEGLALRVCDPTGQRPPRDLPVPGVDGTTALATAPDGSAAFRATPEGDVELIPFEGGQMTRFHAQDGRLLAMQPTPDGRLLTVGQDGIVRGYDRQGGSFRLDVLRGRGRPCEGESLRALAFSDDGTLALVSAVTGGEECDDARTSGALRLVELPTGRIRWEIHPVQVTAALFAADGSVLVAAAGQVRDRVDPISTTLVRLDARNGAPAPPPPGHRAQVTALRFSPDGARIASGDAAGVWTVWDVGTRAQQLSGSVPGGALVDLRFTPGSETLVSQHEDDSVRTWRVADGAAGPVLVPPPAPDPVRSTPACASAQAQVAELMRPAGDSVLGVRDPSAWTGLQTVPELVLSSDGENVLAPVAEESCVSLLRSGCSIGCSRHYHLERVAVRTGRRVQTLPLDQELLGGCIPPGGAFVTRAERGGILLRDAEGEPVARAGSKLGKVMSCEATPDGKRMLLASSKLLGFWEVGRPTMRDGVPRRARTGGPVALSPRGDVSVDADGPELRLRAWPSGAVAGRLTLALQDDFPTSATFSPDGHLLAVGTARGVIHLIRIGGPTATASRH
ncbi:MAG TPA: WD40 repeat domain-containing protein [Myxococcaceae bacterium]|nr:WD40 repeat domain-containing protein [Myxococcaceae bacterium]